MDDERSLAAAAQGRETLRVIVAGGRDFTDYSQLCDSLDALFSPLSVPVTVISGTARGADQLGERYAEARGLTLERYPADWKRYGRRAGYRRNELMAQGAHAVVAFWDGESRGTRHMIEHGRERGLAVIVIGYSFL